MRNPDVVYLVQGERIGRRRLGGVGGSGAIHLLVAAAAAWLSAPSIAPAHRTASRGRAPVVFTTPSLPSPAAAAGPAAAAHDDLGLHIDPDHGTIALPGFRFDFLKVTSRAASLFPFLTGSPLLAAATNDRGRDHGVGNPFAAKHRAGPPLAMSDAELQRVVDSSWSRRDRWNVFGPVASLLFRYDPDQGRLPVVLRQYVEQDGLEPYLDTSTRDPRLWVQLGLVADHLDFLRLIEAYANGHPSTRATTELLFLLDRMVQASYDALATLLDVDPARDLGWTRRANPEAYRALVIIQRHYRAAASRLGLTTRARLRLFYDGVRLVILDRIRATTPAAYRANDALFLAGEVCWRDGKRDAAVRAWRQIVPAPGDEYRVASSALLGVLERERDPVRTADVDRILAAERGRWVSFSFDRLEKFGYRFDTF